MLRPRSVLDIGGGAGLMLFFMKHRYKNLYLLEKNCLRLQNKIKGVRSTLIYNFFTGNERRKKAVIAQLEHDHNVKIDEKDIFKQLENCK